jgi:hypothetical protein
MKEPEWTVCYNIVSPESSEWVGTGWEFFDSKEDADRATARLTALGNVCTRRPFHKVDRKYLGAAHRYEYSENL